MIENTAVQRSSPTKELLISSEEKEKWRPEDKKVAIVVFFQSRHYGEASTIKPSSPEM
jgi:hypothetical protein